ncbi:uncharacterized protein EKO05_0004197 [Ascochyta rabiei]|uniref:Uncharacterized protein n=1 Tax=Didymella rabiei TaxID=5454 RepID=A0A162XK17_DIDRA|nr:uncharacterized protein EKO05_0004197 [Ascochyta rabiei]KZM19592.1 hypothetical protein ST47_g9125 [Ascochyta rabiei]UPX13698.1 hypothetical protein EKO05_0004197 [Ascochyta rabiei]
MSSSYGAYYQGKAAYAPRPSTSSTTASSNHAQSAQSSHSYGGRPQATVVVHKPSGPTYDPNTSTSAGNAGYYR